MISSCKMSLLPPVVDLPEGHALALPQLPGQRAAMLHLQGGREGGPAPRRDRTGVPVQGLHMRSLLPPRMCGEVGRGNVLQLAAFPLPVAHVQGLRQGRRGGQARALPAMPNGLPPQLPPAGAAALLVVPVRPGGRHLRGLRWGEAGTNHKLALSLGFRQFPPNK